MFGISFLLITMVNFVSSFLMLRCIFINAWMQLDSSRFVLDNFNRNRLIAEGLILSGSNGIKPSYFKSMSYDVFLGFLGILFIGKLRGFKNGF